MTDSEKQHRFQFAMRRKLKQESWDMKIELRDPFQDTALLRQLWSSAASAKQRYGRASIGLPRLRTRGSQASERARATDRAQHAVTALGDSARTLGAMSRVGPGKTPSSAAS